MAEQGGNLEHNQQDLSHSKPLEQPDLALIIKSLVDAIFVTDRFGKVLLVNPATGRMLGVHYEELIGKDVRDLVKQGIYDRSPSLEALVRRSVFSGLVRTGLGQDLMATSTPIVDENGEITMVVTNVRDKEEIDKYIAALEEERIKADRYKTAVEYLSELDLEPKTLVAESNQMRRIVAASSTIAKTDSTVLLEGESGTGKEVIARYIHRNSQRCQEPFIPVNCAAIPHELLESEFFGYVRGAFTGANPQGKPGLFEIADKGTLFLDEIAELPLAMQSKLLRVLESGEIQRLGDTIIHRTNVRLIAATNRDLRTMVAQKQFREDLYYRLNVIPIGLPPLRERPEDIIVLANQFLCEFNRKYGFQKRFSAQSIPALLNYHWPGNVRELRNLIERLVITSPGNDLSFEADSGTVGKSLLAKAAKPELQPAGITEAMGSLKSVLKRVEEQYINQVLSQCNGRVGEAARILGIHRTMLYRKTKK